MKQLIAILIFVTCIVTMAYGVNNFTNMSKFNKWLKSNETNYRIGCDENVSQMESEYMSEAVIQKLYKVYCFDEKNDPLWQNEENNLEVRFYKNRWSIPYKESPGRDTLIYYLYKYIHSHTNGDKNTMQWGKYIIQPSDAPYEFKREIKESEIVKNQMKVKPILSYLYYEDGKIRIDEISPEEQFGDFINDETKLRSNSVGKSIVSYVLGHAICNGYIENVDSKINDWPLVEGTLYENQRLIDLLNMAAGDQRIIDENNGVRGIDIDTSTIEEVMPFFQGKKPSQKGYNYNNFISPLILNYISFKAGDDFQLLLDKVFKEKVKIKNSVYFFKKRGKKMTKESGNAQNMFFASRYDYLRIAKAIMDDYQNQTCEGKYLKEIYNRKISKRIAKDDEPPFALSSSYGGQFHLDFKGLKNEIIFGMNGYGGQVILINMTKSRIIVLNSIHFNNRRYKYDVDKLLYTPMAKGI